MDELFKQHAKSIKIYLATERETDPFEHSIELTQLSPIPIKAIVSDISPTSAIWKMPGISAEKTKEIIINKKHENLLKQSQLIEIDKELYEGWRINGRLSYRIEGDYLRAYIYIKKV